MTTASASSATAGTAGRNGRTVLWVVLIVGALLAVGALSVTNRSDIAFDTDSTAPTGTRAFVELLESFGTDVDVPASFPPPGTDLAVMFIDATEPAQTDAVRQWVSNGATLVVTDAASPLTPRADSPDAPTVPGASAIAQQVCTVDALAEVATVDPALAGRALASAPYTFTVGADDASCFGSRADAFVVVTPVGSGRIVSVGSGSVFMNGAIAQADNAALATSLFAPRPGTRVAIVEPEAFGAEVPADGLDIQGSINRLLTFGLRLLVLQVLVAIVVLAVAQGRRLGKPVTEPQPVQIAGSELVRAVGDLMQQASSPARAASVLRVDLRREVCLRLGLAPTSPVEVIAATVDARSGIGRERILAALDDRPVANDRELVELARSIDSLREEVLHGRTP